MRELLSGTGATVRDEVRLADLTTLRVGGPAIVADCPSTDALVATVRALDGAGVPLLLLAGGSNLLIADSGFDGVVVRVGNAAVTFDADGVLAEAGANWDAVVAATVDAGFGGLECLSGIPGSAGATPVQNVGAYGVEVDRLLRRVRLLDRTTGDIRWAEAKPNSGSGIAPACSSTAIGRWCSRSSSRSIRAGTARRCGTGNSRGCSARATAKRGLPLGSGRLC